MESSHHSTIFFSSILLALLFLNCSAARHHQGSGSGSGSGSESGSAEIKTTANILLGISPSVSRICGNTDYSDVCISSLNPFMKGRQSPMTVRSAVRFTIQAALEKTKLAIAEVNRLKTDPGSGKGLKSVLNDCGDSYNDALENYQAALDALPSGDVGTMNSMLSACVTDFGDCDDFLDGYEVALPGMNRELTRMTSNCLAITSLIR